MTTTKQEPKQEQTKAVTVQEKNICDNVLARVKELEKGGNLQIPPNYSPANAMKSAWLILTEAVDRNKKPVLQSCSQASIANSLLDMSIQGLSPAKKQCYFVAFDGKLQLMRSYMGTVAVTKRLKGVKNVVANVIYDGDEFEYEFDLDTGEKRITKHEQDFENIDNDKIKGAYAIVVTDDDRPNHIEIMNINQIKKAWNQGAAKGNSGAHNNFADEMCKKTVINRACKMFVNTSDDSDILVEAINNTEEKEYDEKDIVENVQYEVQAEIAEKGNKKPIDIVETVEAEQVALDTPNEEEGINPPF